MAVMSDCERPKCLATSGQAGPMFSLAISKTSMSPGKVKVREIK